MQKSNINNIALPWKICLLIGVAFGVSLKVGISHDYCIFQILRWLEFHKLNWRGFGASGAVLVILMVLWPRFGRHGLLRRLGESRARLGDLVAFIFNGMVGGYLGIAFWNFYIGAVKDGVDFLGWAFVTYVWFFMSVNVIRYGVPQKEGDYPSN